MNSMEMIISKIRMNEKGGYFTYNDCDSLECCLRVLLSGIWWKISSATKASLIAAVDRELNSVRESFIRARGLELEEIY